MKLLLTKENVVIFSCPDDVVFDITKDKVSIKTTEKRGDENVEITSIAPHLNSTNTIYVEKVTAELPSELAAGKFKYEKNKFTLVEGWVDTKPKY